jgi:hypothetical protein
LDRQIPLGEIRTIEWLRPTIARYTLMLVEPGANTRHGRAESEEGPVLALPNLRGSAVASGVGAALFISTMSVAPAAGQPTRPQDLEAACNAGTAWACLERGLSLVNARNPTRPALLRANEYFRKACDGKNPAGCANLAKMYYRGLALTKDLPAARRLWDSACALGDGPSCVDLGDLLRTGVGGNPDARRAATLYDRACAAGVAIGCYNLASMYLDGLGVPKNGAKAIDALRKGCDLADAASCVMGAGMYMSGTGIAVDRPAAVAMFEKGCAAGDTSACQAVKTFKK